MTPFSWTTRARVSEMGPEGSLSPGRLVDWLQETACNHCDHVGWSVDRLRDEGFLWFVRSLTLIREQVIFHRDEVRVETWVSDRQRFRTHREYRVLRGEEVVARGQADWLFLARTASGGVRPTRFPPEMMEAFELRPTSAIQGLSVPAWVEVDSPSQLRREVVPSELDGNGHVNHAVYLDWLADGYARAGRPMPSVLRLEFLKDTADAAPIDVHLAPAGAEIRSGHEILLRAATAT